MDKNDWTSEEIAFTAARQAEITQQDKAVLELKTSKKPSLFYIVIRLLIGLIPTFFVLHLAYLPWV